MMCKKCNSENKPEAKFCEGCGEPLIVQPKPKKSWYKRWWVWVIVGVLVFGTVRVNANKTSKSKNLSSTAATEQQTEPPTERKTELITDDPEKIKSDFINSCSKIDYEDLSRNPDKYKGENYKFTGKVIQVLDSDSWFSDSTTLRINVTAEENEFAENGYLWNDTILAAVDIPDGNDRILEDDIVDIYGICEGLYTYKTVLGDNNSLPLINIKYFTIH